MTETNIQTLLTTPYFSVIQDGKYYKIKERAEENGVVIMAEREDGRILLAKVFRPAIGAYSFEFPRGAIDEGEDASQAAARELKEETGYGCDDVKIVGKVHSNTSLLCSYVSMAFVKAHSEASCQIDGEVDSIQWLTRDELDEMIAKGFITDSHTLSTYALKAAFVETLSANFG